MRDENQKPGLPAVYELRAARKAGRFARVSPGAVLYSALALAAVMGAYTWWTGYQLGQQRDAILATWSEARTRNSEPLRDVGGMVDAVFADARGPWAGAVKPPLMGEGGGMLYVRVSRADLSKVPARSIHDLAADSSRDALLGCLAQKADTAIDAFPNLHAFENGRMVLDASWGERVRTEDRAVRLSLYQRQLMEIAVSPTSPFAKVSSKAGSILLVVDEADAGEASVYFASTRAPASIGRAQLKVEASVTEAGSHDEVDPKIWASAQRQATGCALGKEAFTFLVSAFRDHPPVAGERE